MISSNSVGSGRWAHPEFCRLDNSIAVARMCLARNSGLRFSVFAVGMVIPSLRGGLVLPVPAGVYRGRRLGRELGVWLTGRSIATSSRCRSLALNSR